MLLLYFLPTVYMPGTVLSAGDTTVTNVVHFLRGLRDLPLPCLPHIGPQITLVTNSTKGCEPYTETPVGAGSFLRASQIHSVIQQIFTSTYYVQGPQDRDETPAVVECTVNEGRVI